MYWWYFSFFTFGFTSLGFLWRFLSEDLALTIAGTGMGGVLWLLLGSSWFWSGGSLTTVWRGLVSAGDEEDEGPLPTASDEGQAEPWDSSLSCCSGDRLPLLLSSSKAYESSCFGNLPWFRGMMPGSANCSRVLLC